MCLDRFEDSAKRALQPGKSHLSGFSLVCLVRLCIAAGSVNKVGGKWQPERGSRKHTKLAGLSSGVVAAGKRALVGFFAAVSALM